MDGLYESLRSPFGSLPDQVPEDFLALDRNEYFFPHPADVLTAITSAGQGLSHYAPQPLHMRLRQELASQIDVPVETLFLGHGAEDLLIKAFTWFRQQSSTLIVLDFSWATYVNIGEGLGYDVRHFSLLEKEGAFFPNYLELDALLTQERSPSLVCLASPNNPTGSVLCLEKTVELIKKYPQHIFIIDGVYDDFRSAMAQFPLHFENCVFLGSFSKYFGLPGLRVGYAVSTALPKAFHLSLGFQSWALKSCLAALEHRETYEKNRAEMLQAASQIASTPSPFVFFFKTRAPFLLGRLEKDHASLSGPLAKCERTARIRPKYLSYNGKVHLRWGLGPSEVIERINSFHAQLDEILLNSSSSAASAG